jgi:HAMP domain-containing protein
MTSESPPDEHHRLETENRHLREMTAALREEMERMRNGEQDRFQKALASAADEIGQLRGTIVALREELENRKIDCDVQCRLVEQAAREETRQLQETVRTMRDRLEGHEER